ncbi:MAG: hypothetical protein MMC23_000158 [Stictis urceolatum]|nr:hypothetical protein [Stictis urceolata]
MSAPVAVLLATWALLCSVVLAQNAVPSNGTIPRSDSTNGTLELQVASNSMVSTYEIHPAWAFDPGNGPNITQLENIVLNGPLANTNAANYNDLETGDFAFISCDPEPYEGGAIDLQRVIDGATDNVRPNSPQTLYMARGGGIILYSNSSSWCNFTIPSGDNYSYQNVFSLTNAGAANSLLGLIQADSEPAHSAIHLDGSSVHNSTDSDNSDDDNSSAFGPSPTTTIAMVILYVITGVITLLFIVIIISGAIRAHRHPERYRGRTLMGRPVQGSRARGLAAAMLDTLPIVKFGERAENKPNDVELQNQTSQTQEAARETPEAETRPETRSTNAGEATGVTGGTGTSPIHSPSTSPETSAEAGLACSVCTDDFVKGQDTRVLPCNHKFHPECIDPWLLNVSGTCPLCRVDLRPPESHSQPTSPNSTSPPLITSPSETHITSPPDRGPSPSSHTDSHNDSHVGPRNRVSTILHRALNRQHMSDATPEQRMEALRDLRNQNRGVRVSAGEQDERMRSRVAGRIGRLLGRERRWEGNALAERR